MVCQQLALSGDRDPDVSIEGLGPSHSDVNETVAQALNLCQVRDYLNGTRHRLLESEFQSWPRGCSKHGNDIYQAAVYDYTNGRTILVNGVSFDPTTASVVEANIQPFTNGDELSEAARIAGAQSNDVVHGSMPPVISREFPNGTTHRLVHLDIFSRNSNRSLYVNMNNGTVEFSQGTPEKPTACEAPEPVLGLPSDKGKPGIANFRITRGERELWTFQATRPSASSGIAGSGIELRNVKYKGKTLLFQAHVPVLNVEYEGVACGPHFRDWQYDEWFFSCNGRDVAQGFRLCSSPAKTILDLPHKDGGNFMGVAVYIDGLEVVLKSQMKAGWYRYISEWRFHVDGTLRPRFGFGGTQNPGMCVCQVHHHHVYWRLDFDIVSPGNNLVREFNEPPIIGTSNYHDKIYEIRRLKDLSHKRRWEISNTRKGDTYSLIPGSNDGTSDSFGVGDLWVLNYHGNELDDGVPRLNGLTADDTRERIDKFLTGENVKNKDVVLWYGAHFKHDQNHEGGGGRESHIVGPDIRPIRW